MAGFVHRRKDLVEAESFACAKRHGDQTSLSRRVRLCGQVMYNALPFLLNGDVVILWLAAGRPLPIDETPKCTCQEESRAPDEAPTS